MKPVEIEILMKGNLGRGLDDARCKAESLDSVLKRVGATVGIAFGTREAIDFARRIMEVRGEVESLQISFETLAGKTKGQKLFGDIREFAVNTPMMMQDLAKGAQTLLGFNIEAEKVMPILRQIGDISMGDAQKFNSLTLAFAQMSSTGKLMGQDLLQMINAGFNPLVVISEKTGKSMAALKKEMSEGRISVKMVEDAFASATAEGGRFHGMLEKQSKGIKGAMSNLQGAWEDMLNDIGEKSQGRMVEAINIVQQLVKNYEKVLDVLAQIVVAYGSYKGALMAVVAVQKAMAIAENIRLVMMFRKEMGLLTAAQQAFNRAALVNPYVLIGVAAAGAGVAVYNLAKADNSAEAAQKALNKTLEDADKLAKDNQRELEELTRTATDEAASTDDRRTAMQQLIDKYPNIIKKYIDEKGHLTDIINLKREIARLDGQEKAGKLEEETNKAKRYLELYDKSRKGNQLSDGERKIMNQLADEIWDQQSFWTKTISGSRGKFVADYYRNQLPGLQRSYARTKTENALREYNNGLEQMTDEQLERMANTAHRALEKIGDSNNSIMDIYTHDFLTKADLGERLGLIGSILDKRHPAKDTTDINKSGRKDTLKEQREQEAKAIEEERRWQEEIAKIKRNAEDAQRDAKIAAIEDDGQRERAEQDEQHNRRLRQIQDQADEMRKAIYEHNKTVWEDAHKDSPYVLTEEGLKGWKGIELPEWQKNQINAELEKENADHLRLVRQRLQDELQAQREYLVEFGTYEEKRKAITEKYDNEIDKARNEWQKKRLRAEKERDLDNLEQDEFRKSEEYLKFFSAIYSLTEQEAVNIGEKIRKNLDEALQNGKISAQEYYEAIEKIDEQMEKIQNDRGSFMAFMNGGFSGLSSFMTQKGRDQQRAGAIQVEKNSQLLKVLKERAKNGEMNMAEQAAAAQAREAGAQMAAAGEAMSQAGGEMAGCVAMIDLIVNGIDAIVQGFNKIMTEVEDIYGESYGLSTKDRNFWNAFSEASSGAASGWNSLKDGDIQGAVNGTIQSWTGWLKMETVETSRWKDLSAHLEKMESALSSINSSLKEQIDMLNGSRAQEASDSLTKNYEALLDQTREVAYAWTGAKTLHNNHRNWWYIESGRDGYGYTDERGRDISWQTVFPEIAKHLGMTEEQLDGIGGLSKLSREQLEWIQKNYQELWIRLPEEFRGYLEDIIGYYKQIEETGKEATLARTGLDLDTLKSDYAEFLSDIDAGNEDMAENFEGYLRKAIMSNLVGDKYQGRIQHLIADADAAAQKAFLENRDLSQEEYAALRAEEASIREDMQRDKERYASMYGWESESGSSQTARRGGFAAMSVDQGTKLDGMFTAGLQHWSSMDKELGNVTDRLGNALDHLRKIEENTEHCKKLDDIAEDIRSIKNSGIKMK